LNTIWEIREHGALNIIWEISLNTIWEIRETRCFEYNMGNKRTRCFENNMEIREQGDLNIIWK
jgi:hypothetical protein